MATIFLPYVHSDLNLEDTTLTEVHSTPWSHEQQLCKLLFGWKYAVESHDQVMKYD